MSLPKLRERHIDRLFSEELEASNHFAMWFAGKVFGNRLPDGTAIGCLCTINFHRVSGETDIFVEIKWQSGITIHIHVEDKIDATPQPKQAERYTQAVISSQVEYAASALIAPNAWIRRHPREASIYDATVSFEDIAECLNSRAAELELRDGELISESVARLRWRANLLAGTRRQKEIRAAVGAGSLNDWNEVAADVIEAKNGLVLERNERQRSKGKNQPSRFFKFDEALTPHGTGESKPILRIKTRGTRPGRVSLDLFGAGNDCDVAESARRNGFSVELSPRGTLMIEASSPSVGDLDINKEVKEQLAALEAAAELAQQLVVWWEEYKSQAPNS